MQNQMTPGWREQHRKALAAVRAALPPGDPRRYEMLRQIDRAASAISAAEQRKQTRK
jgi:hypothetical protein